MLVRGFSALLVLPLLLRRFSAPETAVWYLFLSIISIQHLFDIGFAPTFARVIAYAMGGAKRLDQPAADPASRTEGPNWALIGRIWDSMRVVYRRLSLVAAAAIAVLGTLALRHPIAALPMPGQAWTAWVIIVAVSLTSLWSDAYAALLQGANEVALLKRWDTAAGIGATVTSFAVLLFGGGLLSLVVANQSWALFTVVRNRFLAQRILARVPATPEYATDPHVMEAVWGSAWRSGLAVAIYRGTTQGGGLVLAQIAQPAVVASYLLAMRFIQLIAETSQAPFYSRLPVLARLNAEGRVADQVRLARRGMRMSYWVLVAGCWTLALAAQPALALIHSRTNWVPPGLWALLAAGYFVERYGAMHLTLFSTTNEIVWHIANSISGTIYVVVGAALVSAYGAYALAWGQLVGAVGYAWYSAARSYGQFKLNAWSFERAVALPPAVAIAVLCAIAVVGA